MKKRIAMCLIALCLVLSLGITRAEAAEIDSYPVIELDTKVTVTIENGGDVAYFRFVPEVTDGYYFFSTGSNDTYGYLYDSDMNQIGRDNNWHDGSNFAVRCVLEAGQTYVFAAQLYSSDATGSFDVMLQVNHECFGEEVTPATCTEDGLYLYTCIYCGYSYTEVAPAHGHNYQKVMIPATEESCGLLRYTCSRCGDIYEEPYDYIGEGLCGEELSWTIEEQTLFFTGKGFMDDYSNPTVNIAGAAPWYGYYNNFSTIMWLSDQYQPVKSVGSYAFYDADKLTKGELPFNMLLVEEGAFAECSNLTEMKFPGTVVSVGDKAFQNCTRLEHLGDISSLASIGDSAFENCSSLTIVSVFDALVSIGDRAFANTGLTEIHLPRTVRYIGEDAFDGIENLTIYGSAGSYAETYANEHGYTFYDRGIIESGNHGDNIAWTMYGDHCLVISGTGDIAAADDVTAYPWYSQAANMRSLVIEEGITSIPAGAFNDWEFRRIKHISIPTTIANIGSDVFYYKIETKSVNFSNLAAWMNVELGNYYSMPTIQNTALLCVNGKIVTDLVIPDGTTTIPAYAFSGFVGLKSVKMPESVTSVGDYAFYYCNKLNNVDISSNVTSIGCYAFCGCTSLSSICIPGSIKEISEYAFGQCYNLTKIELQEGVESIAANAFGNCYKLEEITFPSSLNSIGDGAFRFGRSLTRMTFTGDAPSIQNYAFFIEGSYGDITAYYPYSNATWTADVMKDYGRTIIWVPYFNVVEDGTDTDIVLGEEAVVHIDADPATLEAVYMDGVLVDPSNYTVIEGVAIITFHAEFLATLGEGEHRMTAEFEHGVAMVTIVISAPTYTPGDITGDGKVNNRDAARLMQHLAGWDVEFVEAALDVNGDGKVNNRDAARLMQYLAGWDVEIN